MIRIKAPGPAVTILWIVAITLVLTGAWQSIGAATGSYPPTIQATLKHAQQISVPTGSLDLALAERLRAIVGLVLLLALAWGLSVDRKNVPWRVVIWGISLQVLFAVFILRTSIGVNSFNVVNSVIVSFLSFTVDGASFLFGNLVYENVPVGVGNIGQGEFSEMPSLVANTGAFFAFNVLPTIIFFSSLMTVLYHLGIMQLAVKAMAFVMQKTMRTSGAETINAAGNIFIGQTEAPLLIKPFIEKMTMSELMAVMTGGFSTVAGGVLAAYVSILLVYFPSIAGHLIAASVMSAPAALVVAKLMYPEDSRPETSESLAVKTQKSDVNVIDAAARGASEGLFLALNVGAMLLAFIALIYMLNGLLTWLGNQVGISGLTFELIFG